MRTPSHEQLVYRAMRGIDDTEELARQLTVRKSTFQMYFDVLIPGGRPGPSVRSLPKCRSCSGTGCAPHIDLIEAAKWVRARRPPANIDIDQCSVSDIDLARRVHTLLEAYSPSESSFAFLGDDDLASLLLLRASRPRRLLVIDVDDRILASIRDTHQQVSSTELNLIQCNLASLATDIGKLKPHLETYDVVITDPPYADDGMLVFIYTASMLLKLGGRMHLAMPRLTAESWTDDLTRLIQIELLQMGFVIDVLTPGFSSYNESDVLSSLLVCTKLNNINIDDTVTKIKSLRLNRFYTTRKPAL